MGDTASSFYDSESLFEQSSVPHVVSFDGALHDLNATFVDVDDLVEADTWTLLLSACGATNPLPTGAAASLTAEDGTAAVTQLTLDRGFEGLSAGSYDVYAVNQHFTVRAAGTEAQSITIFNLGDSTSWTNGLPSYSLQFNGSSPSACIDYDADDWEVQVSHARGISRGIDKAETVSAKCFAHAYESPRIKTGRSFLSEFCRNRSWYMTDWWWQM